MIKPVYFGKKENQLLEYACGLENFSEWVKDKLKIDMKIKNIGIIEMKQENIESLIRKIIQEGRINSNPIIAKEIKPFVQQDKEIQPQNENEIVLDGWTL